MIILTNMCLLEVNDQILVQNRLKNDWPGLTLPGGKVKSDESIYDSMIREYKEETNLTLINPKAISYIEWNIDNDRHLCILFKCNKYEGEIRSNDEGPNFFINKNDLTKYNFSTDFDKILDLYGIIY